MLCGVWIDVLVAVLFVMVVTAKVAMVVAVLIAMVVTAKVAMVGKAMVAMVIRAYSVLCMQGGFPLYSA